LISSIWSVDRADWIPLSQLQPGERLLCDDASTSWDGESERGQTHAFVLGVTLSTVCEPVYNLEIHGEHVYQVGELGVLVHNARADNYDVKGIAPNSKFRGGKHGDTKFPRGDGLDSNHSPADAISPFRRNDGPAFQMDPTDHRQMSSTGSSASAKAWRKKQQDLIAQGKLREAVQMDIDEARRLFGNKYDDAIQEMLDYITSIGH
jgi:hypothetical protein